jgi:ActR/RegA family two-component response regulator/c-di-GMP-binding flagellar brake protein YcgR
MMDPGKEVDSFLAVGDSALLHLHPSTTWGVRYKTVIRGWDKPYYLIVDRPRVKDHFVGLHRGDPCVVRFLSRGRACGFDSIIVDWDTRRDKPYIRIGWPEACQVVSFRRHERVNVTAPCKLTAGDQTFEGELRDISIMGCRVFVPAVLSEVSTAELSFTLPDGLPVENLQVDVRNIRPVHGGVCLGCEYREGQEHIQSDMAFFIVSTLERSAGETGGSPRALIIDADNAYVGALRREFEKQGWRVFSASSSVEGLLRLRMLPPTALLINESEKDLVGLEILRLLKATRGLELLPVFVYGGAEGAEGKAQELDVAGYFPVSLNVNKICAAVVAAIPPKNGPAEA